MSGMRPDHRPSTALRGTRRLALSAVLVLAALVGCHSDGDDESAGTQAGAKTEPATEADAGHRDKVKLSKEAAEENQIKVEPVTKHVLIPRLHAAARVAFNAEATARVAAPVGGRVAEVKVHLGDAVSHGDELVIVESTDLGEAQSDLLQKNAAVAAAEAAAEAARVSYRRGLAVLEKTEGVARGEVEKRHADLLAAEAAARSAKAAATAARTRLQLLGMPDDAVERVLTTGRIEPTYAVRAPIDGSIIRLDATLGALVAPDKDTLLEMADLRTVWVMADVPEPLAGLVRPGAGVHITTSSSGGAFDGKVSYVSPTVDATTRSVPVRVVVPNENGALRPGMFASADIEEASDTPPGPVVSVPADAVQTIEGETVVFVPVEGEEDTFAKRAIKVGQAVGDLVPVLSGLQEGEKVVTAGAFVLKAELAKPAAEEE
jgi:cobalt-zinc-cadmium efflux system membrane fusion protein